MFEKKTKSVLVISLALAVISCTGALPTNNTITGEENSFTASATKPVQKPEFQVNTNTTNMAYSAAAMDSMGDFAVTWVNIRDNYYGEVYARVYKSTGQPLSQEFKVNTDSSSNTVIPRIAMDSDGDFVVVWNNYFYDESTYSYNIDLRGRKYYSTGKPRGSEFIIASTSETTPLVALPNVAMDPNGNFVVAWMSYMDESNVNISAKRYNSNAIPIGSEFTVNNTQSSGLSNGNIFPSVAMDKSGGFIVAWTGFEQQEDTSFISGIYAKRYTSSNKKQSPEQLLVNSFINTNSIEFSSVAQDNDGGFIIGSHILDEGGASPMLNSLPVGSLGKKRKKLDLGNNFIKKVDSVNSKIKETSNNNFGISSIISSDYIKVKSYNKSGVQVGPQLLSSDSALGAFSLFTNPVAKETNGDFVFTWAKLESDGSPGIYTRKFDKALKLNNPDSAVKNLAPLSPVYSSISMNSKGDYLINWTEAQDGDHYAIFAKLFKK